MLKLTGIHTYYGNIEALKGINLEVKKGEIIALLGSNGAGKTTTLASISGLVPPKRGEIVFDGESIINQSPESIVSKGLIQVPEGRHIFPDLTVLENLKMGAYLRRDKKGIADDLEYVMSLFPILAKRSTQSGGTLSGGEQQMLAISRALMGRPRMLLLDEPSLGLAPLIIRNIFDIIRQINLEQGTTILLVEQNANLALRVAHRAYILTTGSITLSGVADDLLADEGVRKAYLGG
ncbi:branched-chain amino acid ABC transporter ATP-binding protein [Deltaproteobacteria bacterium Smac51]|nr:branched-chain amino acid ABC transporter ATP-binding protein [Deltaproteobacteria bacterium Smac51]